MTVKKSQSNIKNNVKHFGRFEKHELHEWESRDRDRKSYTSFAGGKEIKKSEG